VGIVGEGRLPSRGLDVVMVLSTNSLVSYLLRGGQAVQTVSRGGEEVFEILKTF